MTGADFEVRDLWHQTVCGFADGDADAPRLNLYAGQDGAVLGPDMARELAARLNEWADSTGQVTP